MRVSQVVPSEAEIAIAEQAMRDGLKGDQQKDLVAYFEREKAERLKRQADRQAQYNREQR